MQLTRLPQELSQPPGFTNPIQRRHVGSFSKFRLADSLMAGSVAIDDPMAEPEDDVDMEGGDAVASTAQENLPADDKPEDSDVHVTYLECVEPDLLPP